MCEKFSAYKTAARIDIHCEILAVPFAQLSQMKPGEPSAVIRERVIKARNIQTERFSSLPTGEGGGRGRPHCNAQMTERMLHESSPHHRRPRRQREGRVHAHRRGHRI